jgi:hypothetical protein
VGKFTSLAFGPDGRAAISYSGNNGADLRFARFNGSTWTLATIDAGNESSSSSLSFGLDGQPAIAYHFGSFAGSLRFARLGLFKPAP